MTLRTYFSAHLSRTYRSYLFFRLAICVTSTSSIMSSWKKSFERNILKPPVTRILWPRLSSQILRPHNCGAKWPVNSARKCGAKSILRPSTSRGLFVDAVREMQEISRSDSGVVTLTYTAVRRRAGGRSWRKREGNCPRRPPRTTRRSVGGPYRLNQRCDSLTAWPRLDGCRVRRGNLDAKIWRFQRRRKYKPPSSAWWKKGRTIVAGLVTLDPTRSVPTRADLWVTTINEKPFNGVDCATLRGHTCRVDSHGSGASFAWKHRRNFNGSSLLDKFCL